MNESDSLKRDTCGTCGEPLLAAPTNWFKISSEEYGFIFFHRGLITRQTLSRIIQVIKAALRKKEMLK